ncbi:MAG: HesA/MoeB/ThiF family protein [Candidatus Hodarchaeales archaeon]|jgi:adenylyltransferase/sulfurtransferase
MNDQRYSRQLQIENWDQDKLQDSTVTMIGLGALGTVAAASLAMAGVGTLILVDFDTIEMSNLNRQLFYRPVDIGYPKVDICGAVLRTINPDINLKLFNKHIEQLSHRDIDQSTVILDGLDTFQARRWVNSFCAAKKIPLISGGMYSFLGNIQVIIPELSPS